MLLSEAGSICVRKTRFLYQIRSSFERLTAAITRARRHVPPVAIGKFSYELPARLYLAYQVAPPSPTTDWALVVGAPTA